MIKPVTKRKRSEQVAELEALAWAIARIVAETLHGVGDVR